MDEPKVESLLEINGLASGLSQPTKVEKPWGYEVWYWNQPNYCCKLIHINRSHGCSMHFHVKKHETLVVVKGTLRVEAIVNKKQVSVDVKPGEAFVIAPGFPHRLIALFEDVDLIEASTQHFEEDSVKLA